MRDLYHGQSTNSPHMLSVTEGFNFLTPTIFSYALTSPSLMQIEFEPFPSRSRKKRKKTNMIFFIFTLLYDAAKGFIKAFKAF